jgi:phosphate acetyltransferase
MFGFGAMIARLKKDPKRIVLTEGSDPRILEAASRLLASNFLKPVLLGNEEEIYSAAEEAGFNIRGAQIIDPLTYEKLDEMAQCFYELRKNKGVTLEMAKKDRFPGKLFWNDAG